MTELTEARSVTESEILPFATSIYFDSEATLHWSIRSNFLELEIDVVDDGFLHESSVPLCF